MSGLTFSNELISRDESLHTDFACMLYSKLHNRLSNKEFNTIIKEAVEIETTFITESLPCNLIGMNSTLMIEYIKFVADRLCNQLSYPKIWNAKNPFSFMELISLRPKSNFFEVRVGEYTKADVNKNDFGLSDDF